MALSDRSQIFSWSTGKNGRQVCRGGRRDVQKSPVVDKTLDGPDERTKVIWPWGMLRVSSRDVFDATLSCVIREPAGAVLIARTP